MHVKKAWHLVNGVCQHAKELFKPRAVMLFTMDVILKKHFQELLSGSVITFFAGAESDFENVFLWWKWAFIFFRIGAIRIVGFIKIEFHG